MAESAHAEAIELLLRSMYQPRRGRPPTHEFMFGRPGGWHQGFGTGVHYEESALVLAALAVRRDGPRYLKSMPIEHTRKLLMDFVANHYWHLSDESFFRRFEGSYWEALSPDTKALLAELIANSDVFNPHDKLIVFPLVPVRVENNFDSQLFFLVDRTSLDQSRLPASAARSISPTTFPPYKDWDGKVEEKFGSWLGLRSPAVEAAIRVRAALLGAIALTPAHANRHVFSMRKTFGGWCTIGESITIAFTDSVMPPLMHDIVITDKDHEWLVVLGKLLLAEDEEARRKVRALEYYYRAWFLDPAERFPVLCMTIDSMFGDAARATKAVIEGIRNTLGGHCHRRRVKLHLP